MKALTIKQPFASLIAAGIKEYEFRSWKTAYRGELLIHAGKSVDRQAMKKFEQYGLDVPTGCILAKVKLTDCVPVNDSFRQELREKNFHVYSGTTEEPDWEGYGWKLENAEPIALIPINGKLGLWEYDGLVYVKNKGEE